MLARFILIAAVVCLMVAPAVADTTDCEFGRVYLDLLPTIAVYYDGGDIDLGDIQALDQVCATLTFTVHANGQDIALKGGASKLFKDDIPTSSMTIPVDIVTPAVLTASYGESHDGLPTFLTTYTAGQYGAVEINHTEWFFFGSGDPGTWSHDVTVYICWQGDDAELFQGDYSGAVILWAMYIDI